MGRLVLLPLYHYYDIGAYPFFLPKVAGNGMDCLWYVHSPAPDDLQALWLWIYREPAFSRASNNTGSQLLSVDPESGH